MGPILRAGTQKYIFRRAVGPAKRPMLFTVILNRERYDFRALERQVSVPRIFLFMMKCRKVFVQ